MVQVIQDELKLNGTYQLLVYADIIMGGRVHNRQENVEALVQTGREIGHNINADKTKYLVMSQDQNTG
jgi:hypothetical protein